MVEGQDSSGCDTAETLQRRNINMPTGMQLLCLLVGGCKSQKRIGILYHVLRGSKIVGTLTRTRRSRKCHITLTHSPDEPPTKLSMDLCSAACSPLCHFSGKVAQVTCTQPPGSAHVHCEALQLGVMIWNMYSLHLLTKI